MAGASDHNDRLIERYLTRRLTDAEHAAFELRLLDDAQLFARVQLLDAFAHSLRAESAALAVNAAAPAPQLRAWLRQPLSRAAVVLVCGLAALQLYDAGGAAPPAVLPIDTVFVLEATRGAQLPALSGAPPYLFQVDAGPQALDGVVAVTLRDAAGSALLHVPALPVDAGGWARLVYAQPLAGAYVLELAPDAGSAPTRSFAVAINE